jgi:hypothetical protein
MIYNNDLEKKFFGNTYITGGGRQNYLRLDHLEDPLFTGFTLDIDYITSPLFYTINYSDYGYPNVEGMSDKIESALEYMYGNDISVDEGYEILPLLSAGILDGNKLGFGLQQNVYTDKPLYGATEYIYMVDKRNGGADQNDAKFNRFLESGGDPNSLNTYKLSDTVKTIINDSDRTWAERIKQQNQEQISVCDDIMNDANVKSEHEKNKRELDEAISICNQNNKCNIDGKEYNESQLKQEIDKYNIFNNEFELFKQEIVDWVNSKITGYQNRVTAVYSENKCIQKISYYRDLSDSTKDKYVKELEKQFGVDFKQNNIQSYIDKFINIFNELVTSSGNNEYPKGKSDDGKSFLLSKTNGDIYIRKKFIIDKFIDKLKYFGLMNGDNFNGEIKIYSLKNAPDWSSSLYNNVSYFIEEYGSDKINDMVNDLMTYQCDISMSFDENFTSDKIKNNLNAISKYENALDDIRSGLYGMDEYGNICDMTNPTPDSDYSIYLKAKEKYDNDDYSQAEKLKSIAQSGVSEMSKMISIDDHSQGIMDENYNESVKHNIQPFEVSRYNSLVVSQTVLDMLGFITGMKKMTREYPYVIQGVTGLDVAYNKHYGIKDPYLGSGDDKITLTCLESLDLRVSSMFNRYFNAVYDRQYRRERVPVNLRRFNCSIYVHDIRNFASKVRFDKDKNQMIIYNRILELTDMYYSVIEFRFFDCEIVPEETGNIFNDISNESPSEMKKTNFTFTYGNCVVNFVPQSEVALHDNLILTNEKK